MTLLEFIHFMLMLVTLAELFQKLPWMWHLVKIPQEGVTLRVNMPVLVTGATGFIGSHVVVELLRRNIPVRAMVRDLSLTKMFEKDNNLEFVKADLLDVEALKVAVDNCDDVIHCAAALHLDNKEVKKRVLDPSIKGVENLCNVMSSVKRVVHTSSVAAIRSTHYNNGQVFTNNDWCSDASVDSNPYGYAKSTAERIIRDWAAEREVKLVTINPSIVFGPILHKKHVGGSMAYLNHFSKGSKFVLDIHINFVDVRDVAIAHVNALEGGEDGGRYIIHKTGLWMKEIGEILSKNMEGKFATVKLPTLFAYFLGLIHPKLSVRRLRSALGRHVDYDTNHSFEILSLPDYDIRQTLEDSIKSIRAQD